MFGANISGCLSFAMKFSHIPLYVALSIIGIGESVNDKSCSIGFWGVLSTCEVSSKSVYASRSFGLITHANGKTKKRQKTNKASVTNDTQITHKKIDDRTFHTFCYPLV